MGICLVLIFSGKCKWPELSCFF